MDSGAGMLAGTYWAYYVIGRLRYCIYVYIYIYLGRTCEGRAENSGSRVEFQPLFSNEVLFGATRSRCGLVWRPKKDSQGDSYTFYVACVSGLAVGSNF